MHLLFPTDIRRFVLSLPLKIALYCCLISNVHKVNALLSSWNDTSANYGYCLQQKTNVLYYPYKLRSFRNCTDAIIDLEVKLDSKLHFHPHVDCIFSYSVKMLSLIRTMPAHFLLVTVYTSIVLNCRWPKLHAPQLHGILQRSLKPETWNGLSGSW
jgi:hypothetical protein